MIKFDNVTVVYKNNVTGLDKVSFHIDKGEFVFLVGKTGAGKSSAIKLLTAEIKPLSGDVWLDGVKVNGLKGRKIPFHRRKIGVVFQDFRLLRDKTVYENVALAMEIVGGEQQRVGIARALVNRPSLIIADEPTGNLDSVTATSIMELFEEINRQGTTILMVTHSEKIVNDMNKRVIELDHGMLIRDDKKGVYNIAD